MHAKKLNGMLGTSKLAVNSMYNIYNGSSSHACRSCPSQTCVLRWWRATGRCASARWEVVWLESDFSTRLDYVGQLLLWKEARFLVEVEVKHGVDLDLHWWVCSFEGVHD